jgi:hypothetical protein
MGRSPQRAALSRQILSISLRVTVVEKDVVSLMRRWDGASVFDRAPILLGASGDFTHVRDQPVGVAAERAVHLFDCVQIRELVAIDREIPTTRHQWHAVNREAHPLIQRHLQIEQHEWQKQRVDDRRGQQAEKIAFKDVGWNTLPQLPMTLSKLLVKPYSATVYPVLPSSLLFVDLALEIILGVTKPPNEAFHIR